MRAYAVNTTCMQFAVSCTCMRAYAVSTDCMQSAASTACMQFAVRTAFVHYYGPRFHRPLLGHCIYSEYWKQCDMQGMERADAIQNAWRMAKKGYDASEARRDATKSSMPSSSGASSSRG